jgi:hypothetical protein
VGCSGATPGELRLEKCLSTAPPHRLDSPVLSQHMRHRSSQCSTRCMRDSSSSQSSKLRQLGDCVTHLGAREALVPGHALRRRTAALPCSPEPLVVLLDAVGGFGAVAEQVQQQGVQLRVGRGCRWVESGRTLRLLAVGGWRFDTSCSTGQHREQAGKARLPVASRGRSVAHLLPWGTGGRAAVHPRSR